MPHTYGHSERQLRLANQEEAAFVRLGRQIAGDPMLEPERAAALGRSRYGGFTGAPIRTNRKSSSPLAAPQPRPNTVDPPLQAAVNKQLDQQALADAQPFLNMPDMTQTESNIANNMNMSRAGVRGPRKPVGDRTRGNLERMKMQRAQEQAALDARIADVTEKAAVERMMNPSQYNALSSARMPMSPQGPSYARRSYDYNQPMNYGQPPVPQDNPMAMYAQNPVMAAPPQPDAMQMRESLDPNMTKVLDQKSSYMAGVDALASNMAQNTLSTAGQQGNATDIWSQYSKEGWKSGLAPMESYGLSLASSFIPTHDQPRLFKGGGSLGGIGKGAATGYSIAGPYGALAGAGIGLLGGFDTTSPPEVTETKWYRGSGISMPSTPSSYYYNTLLG